MTETYAQRSKIREDCHAGRLFAAQLIEDKSAEDRQAIEADVAGALIEAFKEGADDFLQGQWHIVGERPLCYYAEALNVRQEAIA